MRNKIMNPTLIVIAAIVGILMVGLAYADMNSNTVNTNTVNSLGANSLGTNSLLVNSSNSMIPINIHKSAEVTCFSQLQDSVGNSVECGHWSVLLSNISSTGNTIATILKINATSNGTSIFARTVRMDSGDTKRVCIMNNDDMQNFDSIGLSERCLFVTVNSISNKSAEIQLVGVRFMFIKHADRDSDVDLKRNESNDDVHATVKIRHGEHEQE